MRNRQSSMAFLFVWGSIVLSLGLAFVAWKSAPAESVRSGPPAASTIWAGLRPQTYDLGRLNISQSAEFYLRSIAVAGDPTPVGFALTRARARGLITLAVIGGARPLLVPGTGSAQMVAVDRIVD